jgi:hypothetical protein
VLTKKYTTHLKANTALMLGEINFFVTGVTEAVKVHYKFNITIIGGKFCHASVST